MVFDWLEILGLLIGVFVAAWGVWTYRRAVVTRHAEWLHSLYSKFYEESHYKKTRRLLDYGPADELQRVYDGLRQGDAELSEPIVDYLNFFEFIAGLWVMGELSTEEIRHLFDYYLRLIARHPPILEFVATQGFENLVRLLKSWNRNDQ
jgi:hypothetical protein